MTTTPTPAAEVGRREEKRAMSERTLEPKYEELPIGAAVLAFPGSRGGRAIITATRSEPWTLPSGERVVMVEGYAGGIALSHIEVIPTSPEAAS